MNNKDDGIFKPVFLTWAGKEYEVPADRVMMLIATVEQYISISDLAKPAPPMGAIARAYAAALQYAGARGVTAEHIYKTYFTKDAAANYSGAVNGLLMMMIPPDDLIPPGTEPAKKKQPARKRS